MDNVTLWPAGTGSPPSPSSIVLGSWLMADPGPDYGAKGLIESIESANALYDGGQFGFRYAPPRKMALPLMLNSLYGVNRVPNAGFETGTYNPLGLASYPAGSFVVLSNASTPVASFYAAATVAAGTAAPALTATFASLPAEGVLIGALFCDFSPSSAGETPRSALRFINNAGSTLYPDQAAPGYQFGHNGLGSFTLMNPPNAWTAIGGILSPNGVASLLAGGTPVRAQFVLAQTPTVGGKAGASYVTVGVDELEVRSAQQQRSIREWESELRTFARSGAFVSVQPEGVPSSEAVFFDILDGRWEPDYNIFHNRAGVRKGTLFLDTQPYGYWPTEIVLASAASVGWNGQMFVNGASVIGDVAPLAHVLIQPTAASVYPPGPWYTDMLAWSLSGSPSFSPFVAPAKFAFQASPPPYTPSSPFTATLTADPFAPASQAWLIAASAIALAGASAVDIPWTLLLSSSQGAIPSALEPAYRGRFRAFALVRSAPSMAPWLTSIDAAPFGVQALQALGSANQVATFGLPAYPSWGAAGGIPAPTSLMTASAYVTLDLGELSLPPAASGLQQSVALRLWAAAPSGLAAVNPTPTICNLYFGGVFLLPVDGMSGVLPAGLAQPSVGAWNTAAYNASSGHGIGIGGTQVASPATSIQGSLEFGNRFIDSTLAVAQANASAVLADLRALHHGIAPRLGATTNQLVFITGDRRAGATTPVLQANFEYAQVSVSYRPQFEFLYGV